MLISESYRQLNADMHASKTLYGVGGARHVSQIVAVADRGGCQSILDYGCGKGDLKKALQLMDVREYDPAIEGKDARPEPADLVYCGDVLEHVEPECLNAVLDDLRFLTLKLLIASVHTGEAKKHLPDGRNAHLTQQPVEWWLPKLWHRWAVSEVIVGNNGFWFVGKCTPSI